MAGEAALGRAVLELSTDGKQLDAGLADVPKKVAKVGESVKGLAGPLGQVNGLLGTFGVGLSVGAVVAFGKSILDLADNVVKVHDRTGLATDDVQRLQYIAEQSGNSIDDLAGSISKLQVRLADGKAKAGIEALGLNFKQIRDASPYDALSSVAEAIGKIENPTLRAQRAVEVFGKAGTEILPTLVSNFKELGAAAPIMSEETVLALDSAGDAIARFGSTLKVWAAESYNYARGFFDKLVAEAYRMVQRLYENAAGLAALAAKLPGASKIGVDQKLVDSLKESAVWYGNVAKAMDTTTVAAKSHGAAVGALPPIVAKATAAQKEQAAALEDIRRAAIPLTAAQQATAVANEALGVSASTTAKALGVSADAVTKYLDGLKNGEAIAEAWKDAHAKMAEASHKFITAAIADWQDGQQKIADASGKALADQLRQSLAYEQRTGDLARSSADLKIVQIERERDAEIAALNSASTMRGPIYDRDLAAIKAFYKNQLDAANGTASTIEQRMRSQGVLTRAELQASADAATRDYEQMRDSGLYATSELQAAWERMQAAIDKTRGATVQWGSVLASVAGILADGFGTGGKMGAAISGLSSVAKSIDVAAASTKQWGNSAGVAAPLFSSSATGAQKAAAAVASGATIASGAMDVWAATAEKTGKATGALHGAVAGAKAGAAFGPYGVAIGAVAGALVGLIRNLNAGRSAVVDFAKTFDTAAAGTGFDELHAKLLKVAGGEQLWIDATQKVGKGDVTAAKKAIEAINAALADQDNWLQRLPGVLEKYGIAWEQAGQAVNQARLDEQAKQLIQDFADLSRAGVDVETITTKMSDSVNAYIQDAIRTGTEIPPAMRPLLQKMIELGTLTDANGNKITDLEGSGITFAQTMTEGFQSVVGAIKELTKALGGVPAALDKIPNSKTIDVEFRQRTTGIAPGENDYEGGDGEYTPVPMAKGGRGRVLRPTLFYSRGNEDFAFSGEGKSFGLAAVAQRPIEITNVTQLDGRVVARNQARHLPNELERVGVRSR
jgi:predicted transcriptional regulator